MHISKLDNKKVKITLTNTEVLCCFSSYEKLMKMDESTKIIIKALLREITESRFENKWTDISVNIRAKVNQGCIMIITPTKEINSDKTYILEFLKSENLIKSALFLARQNNIKIGENSLYKMDNSYRLITESEQPQNDFYIMNEFCDKIYSDKINQQFTYEYGKPLIENNAIKTIYNAFIGS